MKITIENGIELHVYEDGSEEWFLDGKFHRIDGPAAYYPVNRYKSWWLNGKRHRLDGPSIEINDKPVSWDVYGRKVNCKTQIEFERLVKLMVLWE